MTNCTQPCSMLSTVDLVVVGNIAEVFWHSFVKKRILNKYIYLEISLADMSGSILITPISVNCLLALPPIKSIIKVIASNAEKINR